MNFRYMQPGDDCQKYAKQKMPDAKESVLYYSIYVKF